MAGPLWKKDAAVNTEATKNPWEADYAAFSETISGIGQSQTASTTAAIKADKAITPTKASVTNDIYKVQSGDTLEAIAANNPFTLSDILAVNPKITDPAKISLGQAIVLPTTEQTTKPYRVPENTQTSNLGILDFISKGEGGYNSSNRGTIKNEIVGSTSDTIINGKPLEQSTISEIMAAQADGLFAVGRYQFIPSTLAIAVKEAGISEDTVFTPAVQDRLGLQLLLGSKRPALSAYLKGDSEDIKAAMLDFAKEWASVPDPDTNKSYYEGTGNKAKHTVEETTAILQSARETLSKGS
jgi:LysM repeat protein